MNPSLTAGAVSGAAGLFVFLVIHHFWITPIWFILPIGLMLAIGGGMAVGWAYQSFDSFLPSFPGNILALSGLIILILLPALVLVHFRPPIFEMTSAGAQMMVSTGRAVWTFIFELVLTAVLVSLAVGWLLGKTPQAALRTGVAGLVFALGPGHNIPFISGSWPAVFRSWILLGTIIFVSAMILVLVEARLKHR